MGKREVRPCGLTSRERALLERALLERAKLDFDRIMKGLSQEQLAAARAALLSPSRQMRLKLDQ